MRSFGKGSVQTIFDLPGGSALKLTISRYFTPKEGIAEDPVTGAAHCVLAPYWAKRLKKDQLWGRQVSKRGGDVFCAVDGKRVKLSGYGVLYMKGEIVL